MSSTVFVVATTAEGTRAALLEAVLALTLTAFATAIAGTAVSGCS
jgi:hypothetical protein